MDGIKSIASETTDLKVHVDLCQQRWDAVYKKISKLEVICFILLVEATINIADAALEGRIISVVRALLSLII